MWTRWRLDISVSKCSCWTLCHGYLWRPAMIGLLVAMVIFGGVYLGSSHGGADRFMTSHNTNPIGKVTGVTSKQCDIATFNRELTSKDPRKPNLALLSGCHVVLYTRTPKSASRTVRDVFTMLAERYGRFTAQTNYPVSARYSEENGAAYVRELLEEDQPIVITRHMFFRNYSRLSRKSPVLLNVIRRPIEHAVSVYSYARYGSVATNRQKQAPPRDVSVFNQTLNDCLLTRGLVYPCYNEGYSALRYLCGVHPLCSDGSRSKSQLQRAKRNLDRSYLLVGLTEELDSFFFILEAFLPHLFYNATAVYKEIRDNSFSKWRTIQKEELNETSHDFLSDKLANEIDLYHYAQARLHRTVAMVTKFKDATHQTED